MSDSAYQDWLQSVYQPAVDKAAERRESFKNSSGYEIQPTYGQSPFSGVFPFRRGIHPTMYRSRPWTMRQYAGFGDARASNERYRYLIEQGQTGISVAFDLPTQMGFDSDSSRALGEVGKVGVAIDSIEDMRLLMGEIPMDRISTSMTINATASTLLCLYIAVAEERGIGADKLRGTIQNDILKEYMARGTYIYPPRPSMRIITDIFDYCREHVPKWNTISISGYHIREAGSTAVQEVAFTLADAVAYVEAALNRGQKIDEFAPRLAFFFNVHNNFFEEVAKFRAARELWARIMRERFHAQSQKSQMLRFHSQTAGSTLTAQQPDNNVVRVALQALAAVLGGTQSLHTNSKDEALALPSEDAARLALRTQQILLHETGVADVADPLGGSAYVEALTQEIMDGAKKLIDKIDDMGGMIAAIEQGYPQRAIQDAAFQTQLAIERGQEVVVGVNQFSEDEAAPADLLRVDAAVERAQVERLKAFKEKRAQSATDTALAALTSAAKTSDNLLPHILASVQANATVGEIANTLREVFGEHREISV